MQTYNVLSKTINISMDKGLFTLGFAGASGKTYLYNLLKGYVTMEIADSIVLPLTYPGKSKIQDNLEAIQKFNGKLIFCDRFDLWCTDEIKNLLIEKSRDCLVLVDFKNIEALQCFPANVSNIELGETGIEVKDYVHVL